MKKWLLIKRLLLIVGMLCFIPMVPVKAVLLNLSNAPLFVSQAVPPLVMLVMGRDHKLYYEAYNDASDLNFDGNLDIRYIPSIVYYGYFDSTRCYSYSGSQQRFNPKQAALANMSCPFNNRWSGNYLNYLTMSRMDALRKVLYGGYRVTDSTNTTILQRSHVPQDAHSWGKEYTSVAVDGYDIRDYTPFNLPAANRRILFANTTLLNGNGLPLLRVLQNETHRIWEWVSIERPVAGDRVEHGGNGPQVNPTDYVVRVRVCVDGKLEVNCQLYPSGKYKPIGILQEFGENDSVMFGLLTGSYTKNLSGGVLRKKIESFTNEIDSNNGTLTNQVGIIKTIDRLQVIGFGGSYLHQSNCGFIFSRDMLEGECRLWGNPVGEMMYESLRYFAGKGSPTSAFNYGGGGDDAALGLPLATWEDPYAPGNFPSCAKPNMLVISDINPSYDSDQVPGTAFGSFSGDVSGLNAASIGNTIWNNEIGGVGQYFIGQSGAVYDGVPTAKSVSSFGNIRGLAPEEPARQGSYYSASIAHFGYVNDVNSATDDQKIATYSVALASPLPEIVIPVAGNTVRIVPFAKSVGGCPIGGAIDIISGAFQPTNTIVDFYVEQLTTNSGVFRVNFEDAQQGADHDMDAIVRYEYVVNPDNTITVTLNSTYAAGCIIQHMGYVISGTTADGPYLEVRDLDTSAGSDPDYFADTPPGELPGGNWDDNQALPLVTSRTFTPSSGQTATFLKDPLWIAAKYGNFNDINNNNLPDATNEWDQDADGVPDNYFLVTNALTLSQQLQKALSSIIERSSSASASAVNSGTLSSSSRVYQGIFISSDWSGQLLSFPINSDGSLDQTGTGPNGAEWDAGAVITSQNWDTGRNIITYKPSSDKGIKFRWVSGINGLDQSQMDLLDVDPLTGNDDNRGEDRLEYVRGKAFSDFRTRSTVLGDVVNSALSYVAAPVYPYPNSWPSGAAENGATYSAFRSTHSNRTPVLYVGANDGMLHAINAATGAEIFAYVPSSVYKNLNRLTDNDYSHRFFVDGTPTTGDVFFAGSWRSVLVGGLNNGGRGIYALNITDPSGFTENNASNMVLWEFTNNDDADLGYTYSQPAIVRMSNGRWAAVFGNGYNNMDTSDGPSSSTGNAVLYIVDIETGALIKKIDTGVGATADPLGLGRPNGLNTPAAVDIDGNYIVDYIYVGDLFGNLWKIDVRDGSPGNWGIAYSGNPVYVALDNNGVRQPITSRPNVGRASAGALQIYFGTGKYLEISDKDTSNATMQTFYGIIDDHSAVIAGRIDLLEQSILAEQVVSSVEVRITSDNALTSAHKGWYMDLALGASHNGERQVTNSVLRAGRIIFTTMIPDDDICAFGGDGWLMELTASDGSPLNIASFDINQDGIIDSLDLVNYNNGSTTVQIAPSGKKSTVGIIPTPGIISDKDKEFKYTPGSSGGLEVTAESIGVIEKRQSWRQLR